MTTSIELVRQQSPAYSRANLTERQQYIAMLARAGDLLPEKLRGAPVRDPQTNQLVTMGNVGKTFLLAETGDMLGIHPMAAMTGVHIIDGKPSISANLMSGLVRKAGHTLRVKVTGSVEAGDLQATAQLIRVDDPDFTFEVTWTLADAERAGLWPAKPNSNWQKYPKAMLKARVISEIVREAAGDVLMGGSVYTPEELGAAVDEQGDPVEMPQVPEQPQQAPAEAAPEQPAAAPEAPKEAPIADGPAPDADALPDYPAAIRAIKTRADAAALYQQVKHAGHLDAEVKVGRKKVKLGEEIVRIGQALAEAEAAPPAADPTTGEVQEDVVVAEIVEDEHAHNPDGDNPDEGAKD